MEAPSLGNARYFHALSVRQAIGLTRYLVSLIGVGGTLKTILKLVTRRRQFYGVIDAGRLVHTGWIALGFCRHYHVETTSAVMGPIWSDPGCRGKGYATGALIRAINQLIGSGIHRFYIDTSEDNVACRRVIEKAGFGAAKSVYER